jgi:hypothetical protein
LRESGRRERGVRLADDNDAGNLEAERLLDWQPERNGWLKQLASGY